ncbi:MAG: S4 domain-containing protein [Lawsonibacter sp.]
MRLDAVLASGFSTSRSKAAELVSAGRVSVNHRECAKPDRVVEAGDVLTCRGLGKCVVREVLGQSKRGVPCWCWSGIFNQFRADGAPP